MKNPFFSIILATYNRAHLLPRAIASVFSQDYADWELLVVDDGSVDATESLMRDCQNQDPRVRYLKKSHSGLAKTRNAGLSEAKGSYVTFLDSD
ncbi:MAG: glycosyltransferase, partial [Deltaproteobacteria bacterium]|nr:glycosyltransferase [Deltaproteobacteria bacterium]